MAMLTAGMADIVPKGELLRRASGGPVNGSVTYDFREMAGQIRKKKDEWFPPMPPVFVGGGNAVERWRPMVLAALARQGFPATYADRVLMQIRTESGGNPNAINLWDINAKRGTPSMGLLQTIMPTFMRHRDPALPATPYDPFANINASLRYARARYGTLDRAYRGVGYTAGGVIPGTPTGRDDRFVLAGAGERVLSHRQTEAFDRLVDGLDRRSLTPVTAVAGPAVSGSGGPSVLNYAPHQEITLRETLDLDLFNQRQEFAVRSLRS